MRTLRSPLLSLLALCLATLAAGRPAAHFQPSGLSAEGASLFDQLERHRSGRGADAEAVASALSALSERPLPEAGAERAALARSWKLAADLVRETEGTTPLLAEALRVASSLDPDNESLAREYERERRRQEKIQRRLDQARRLAEAKRGASASPVPEDQP